MPKIPDAADLGARPIPQSRRGISVDRSGQILGEAVAQAGAQLSRTAAVMQEREDRFAYAKAKSALLQADIETRRSLENDPDWASYEGKYRDAMGKALEGATGLITGNRDRALFSEDAKLDIERGALDVHRLARGKEVDVGRADLDSLLAGNRTAALNARDESTRAALIRATQDALKGAQSKGYIDAQTATQTQQKWTADYAEGYLDMQDPLEQRRLLSNPQGTVADYIAPDKRAVMLARVEKAIETEQRVAESHALAMAAAVDAQHQRAQRNAADLAWRHMAEGGTVASMPADLRRSLDGRDLKSMLDDEKERAKGSKVETDPEAYYALQLMSSDDPAQFQSTDLRRHFAKLSPTDRKHFMDLQSKAATDDGKLEVATLNNLIGRVKSEIPKKDFTLFQGVVQDKVSAEQKRLGRKLSQDEQQKIIDSQLISGEVVKPGFHFVDPDKKQYQVEGTPDEAYFEAEIPEQERQKMEAALLRAGREPTPEAMQDLWRRARQ